MRIFALGRLVLIVGLGAALGVMAADVTQPNIILIMADDLGYEAVSANGSTSCKTPHLDRMAATGMRFERCFVQPLCTPTRVQLMTGLYNVRNYSKFGVLDRNAITFGHLFKRAGYSTGIVGKWQLGRQVDAPKHFGFDESCLWQHTRRPPRFANPGLEFNGVEKDFSKGEYGPELVNDFALDFITRHKAQPFFLYYPMILTHDPFQPTPDSPDWDPKARGEKVNRHPRHFPEMVAYMDKLIGRLVDRLEKLNLRRQTLVMFLGDNGTHPSITSSLRGKPYRGGKGSPIAAGMHVPFIANWPGVIPAGQVCADLIDSTDFLPTLCAAAHVDPSAVRDLDGHSFLPQLRGEKGQPRPWIYCWYSRNGGAQAKHEFALNKRYKLYRDGALYDIQSDPREKAPLNKASLSSDAGAAVAQLRSALDKYAEVRPARLR